MSIIDTVNRIFREFKRYTGDGMAGEPTGAPLPIGDPQSGPYSPKKSELRAAFVEILGAAEGDAEAAAEALAELERLYLGAKAADPTTDNAGGVLETGALYFNTVDGKFRVWNTSAWQDQDVALNDGDVSEPKLAGALALTLVKTVDDIAALKEVDNARYTTAVVRDASKRGVFTWSGADLSATLAPASVTSTAVDSGTETITKTAHGLYTTDAVISTTSVNGLTAGTIYYVIRVTADTFRLASSHANAISGTAFNLTGTTNFTVKRLADPLGGVYVIKTGGAVDGSTGAWVRQYEGAETLTWWGTDAAALQAATDFSNDLSIPAGNYTLATSIWHKHDSIHWRGEGKYASILNWTITSGYGIRSVRAATTTLLNDFLCEDLQLTAASLSSGGGIIRFENYGYSTIQRCYFFGVQVAGTYCIDMRGTWPYGSYYNRIEDNIFGLMAYGVYMGDGANNNIIAHNRFQQAVAAGNGQGLVLDGSNPGYISSNHVEGNIFELTGNTMYGIYAGSAVDGLTIIGNRFESLLAGLTIAGAKGVSVPGNNYFESCTSKVVNSGTGLQPVLRAAASFNGVAGVALVGSAYGCTVTRGGTGTYTLSFDKAFANAGYQVSVLIGGQFSVGIAAGGQTSTFVTFETRVAGVLTDAGNINVMVFGHPA